MLLEGNTDLINSVERSKIAGRPVEILRFHDDKVLVLSENAIALYRSVSAITDPLGNGLIAMAELPENSHLAAENTAWVSGHAAGYIGLTNGHAILILPTAIRLYSSKDDALRNQHCLVSLPLD